MPKKRSAVIRQLPARMHIYCEGEKTEPNYIGKYIRANFAGDRRRDLIIVEPTRKNTPIQLVEEAIRHKRRGDCPPGDVFWVVYDREAVAKYDDELHLKAQKKAKEHGINVALSNVCFELWILLHFRSNSAAYASYLDLMSYSNLRSDLQKAGIQKYDKGVVNLFDLFTPEMIREARKRAKSMNAATLKSAPAGISQSHQLNPYTDMHLLLDAIDNF